MAENQTYTIAEEYRLPSEGKIYKTPINPVVKLRSMTIAEEMLRTNPANDGGSATLCSIIDACLVTKLPISTYDLCLADYEYLLHKLRVVTYGPDYKMTVGCPHCIAKGNPGQQTYVANLDDLKVVRLDTEENLQKFNDARKFILPVSKKEIVLRVPTARLEDTIEQKIKDYKKEVPDSTKNMRPLFTLETMIETVDGSRMNSIELEALVQYMKLADYNMIMKKIDKMNAALGIDKKVTVKCKHCGGEFLSIFRVTSEFFGPEID